jgi:hypothetical protein
MGKITTGGKYRPSIIGVTNGAISAATITTVTVAAAVATEVARLLAVAAGNITLRLFGPPSAAGTNAATNITVTAASGTTLTFTSAAIPAYVDKSLIQATDGSQLPLTLISEPAGIDVTAMDATTNVDQMLGRWLKGADVYSNMVIAGQHRHDRSGRLVADVDQTTTQRRRRRHARTLDVQRRGSVTRGRVRSSLFETPIRSNQTCLPRLSTTSLRAFA